MRVQIATYNGHLGEGLSILPIGSEPSNDLSKLLSTTLNSTSRSNGDAPDLVAVGFQEMIPLVSDPSTLS